VSDHQRGTESSETDRDADATQSDARRGTGDADAETVDARLRAVERAVAGTDGPVTDIADCAAATTERERLAERLDAVEERVAELEAATQAVRGYAGAIRAVNREVERRADLALARATAARGGGEADDGDRSAVATPDPEAAEVGGVVPSERALDAALPSDGGDGAAEWDGTDPDEGPDPNGIDGDETDGEPLGSAALERLRESL